MRIIKIEGPQYYLSYKQYKDNYSNINWRAKKKVDNSPSPNQIKFCEAKANKKSNSNSPKSLSGK